MKRGLPTSGAGLALAFLTILLLGGALAPTPVLAQEPAPVIEIVAEDQVQELELRDGSTLFGRVVTLGDPFRFLLLSGQTLEVRHADVRRLRIAPGQVTEGQYWRPDPNRTRLFFGPTGRSLRAGEGYLSVFEIFFPVIAFGLTDRITIAGGTPLIFGNLGGQPFWFAPKVGLYERENLAVAAGVLAFFAPGSDDRFGIFYGAASIGSPDKAVHLGAGYGYLGGDLADHPALMLGGETRVGRNLKLLTENYLFPDEGGVLSAGIRFFGERLSADLGLATPLGTGDDFFAFPVVNFVWNF